MSEKIIIIDDLEKRFLVGDTPVKVFEGFNLSVAKGEKIALTGPSGSGKSTLLNIIGGLDSSDSGKVNVNGKELVAIINVVISC